MPADYDLTMKALAGQVHQLFPGGRLGAVTPEAGVTIVKRGVAGEPKWQPQGSLSHAQMQRILAGTDDPVKAARRIVDCVLRGLEPAHSTDAPSDDTVRAIVREEMASIRGFIHEQITAAFGSLRLGQTQLALEQAAATQSPVVESRLTPSVSDDQGWDKLEQKSQDLAHAKPPAEREPKKEVEPEKRKPGRPRKSDELRQQEQARMIEEWRRRCVKMDIPFPSLDAKGFLSKQAIYRLNGQWQEFMRRQRPIAPQPGVQSGIFLPEDREIPEDEMPATSDA